MLANRTVFDASQEVYNLQEKTTIGLDKHCKLFWTTII